MSALTEHLADYINAAEGLAVAASDIEVVRLEVDPNLGFPLSAPVEGWEVTYTFPLGGGRDTRAYAVTEPADSNRLRSLVLGCLNS